MTCKISVLKSNAQLEKILFEYWFSPKMGTLINVPIYLKRHLYLFGVLKDKYGGFWANIFHLPYYLVVTALAKTVKSKSFKEKIYS